MAEITVNVSGTITIACPDIAPLLALLRKEDPAASEPDATPAVTQFYTAPASSAPAPPPLTTPPGYTHLQIMEAGADLLRREPAKQSAVMALLQPFGVVSVEELTAEQLPQFATALRALGAQI